MGSATLRLRVIGAILFTGGCRGSQGFRPNSWTTAFADTWEGFDGRRFGFLTRSQASEQLWSRVSFIGTIDNPVIRDLFRLALGSVMVSMSNYSYEPASPDVSPFVNLLSTTPLSHM